MALPGTPQSRDLLSSIVGSVLIVAGGFFLYRELMPWYAFAGTAGVGLYLLLPRRMRTIGDTVVELVKKIRESG